MSRLLIPLLLFFSLSTVAQTATEFYDKGTALKTDGKVAEAIAAFSEATKLDPDYTAAWYEMGWCSNDLKKYSEALTYLRKARKSWPSIPKVYFELGYAFRKLNMLDSATTNFNRCLELKPDYSLAYKELGNMAYDKDKNAEALDYYAKYEQNSKSEITDYLFWYRKGFILNGLKRYSEAVTSLERAKSLKPDYFNTHLELGFAASRLKQSDVAIAHYKKAIEIDSKSHIPYNGIGEVYRDYIKDRDEAMNWYRKSLAIKTDERKACFGMGYCLNSKGNYSEAVPYLKKAIQQESDYTAAYVELGYSYYMLSNNTLALDNFDKAISLNPANENSRYYKGLVYINQKNKTMAQKMVDELKSLNSKHSATLQEKINKM